jgi:signal transduction histidine kinase
MLTLFASIIILSLGFTYTFQTQELSSRVANEKLAGKVNSLHQEVFKILEMRISALELIAEQISKDIDKRPFKASNYYELLGLYVKKFNMSAAGICNIKGDVLESYNESQGLREKFLKVNLYDHGFINAINKRRTSVIMPVRAGKFRANKVMIMASPVIDKMTNKIVAYVGASILPSDLQMLAMKALKDSPELKFMIMDENRVGLSSNIINMASEDSLRVIHSPVYQNKNEVAFAQGVLENGIESRVASKTLHFKNRTFILSVAESLKYLKQQHYLIWREAAFYIVLSILISSLISLWISHIITKPISKLVLSMKKIEEGKFNLDLIKEGSRFQETHDAWDALISMEKKLRENREILEEEVKERTQELIQTHKDLEEQRSRAVEASRLASLGEMAGGIAHEINNPLQAILGSAEKQLIKIRNQKVDLANMSTSLKLIVETSKRIAKIINGLRSFSYGGARESLEKVSIEIILTNTLSFCLERFRNHDVRFQMSPIPINLSIRCCPTQISQVILNLLNNAFDAIKGVNDKWIALEVIEGNDFVEIHISDSGGGIHNDFQEKIFFPFFTTKDIGEGTGLGLSISKGIIESHNGKVYLDKESKHTKFIILLPKIKQTELLPS